MGGEGDGQIAGEREEKTQRVTTAQELEKQNKKVATLVNKSKVDKAEIPQRQTKSKPPAWYHCFVKTARKGKETQMVSECVLLVRIQGAMQSLPQCKCKVVVTVVVMFENVSSGHEHGMICSADYFVGAISTSWKKNWLKGSSVFQCNRYRPSMPSQWTTRSSQPRPGPPASSGNPGSSPARGTAAAVVPGQGSPRRRASWGARCGRHAVVPPEPCLHGP